MQNRCSYCYGLGHNRRTCDTFQKRLEESAASGSHYAQASLESRGKGKKKEDRKCSFCETRGHDRRTCDQIKDFVKIDSLKTLETREIYKDRMESQGFGVGCLVSFEDREYNYTTSEYDVAAHVGVVDKVVWEDIDHRTVDNESNIVRITYFASSKDETKSQRSRFMCLPHEITTGEGATDLPVHRRSRVPKMIASVDTVTAPGNFLSSKAVEKTSRAFTRDLTSWSYDVRRALDPANNS
tara:strand:- start:237 stop:956 length:720 start_codon:yes stop_codon:yes gene_type:complete